MTAASMARETPARRGREWTGPNLPKPAWIAIMVLGFIVFWPIGLAILGFLLFTGRLGSCADSCDWISVKSKMRRGASTGNAAFDEYREETLRRLDEERREFAMFMERLRRAKDQAEFDQFMAERNGGFNGGPHRGDAPNHGSNDGPNGKPSA